MARLLDLSGQRFGRLTVTGYAGPDNYGRAKWACTCECGSETIAGAGNLKTGTTKSCGCLRNRASPHRLDLSGERFGRLVVREIAELRRGRLHWKCDCDCGSETVVSTLRLQRGHTKSCGCLQQDTRRRRGVVMGALRWGRAVRSIHAECLRCGATADLHAHHIYPQGRFPKLARDMSNGATLCAACHGDFHQKYGKTRCGPREFSDWLGLDTTTEELLTAFVGWKDKGGVEDLKKARHFLDILIERG
jgi:hypothetical protein